MRFRPGPAFDDNLQAGSLFSLISELFLLALKLWFVLADGRAPQRTKDSAEKRGGRNEQSVRAQTAWQRFHEKINKIAGGGGGACSFTLNSFGVTRRDAVPQSEPRRQSCEWPACCSVRFYSRRVGMTEQWVNAMVRALHRPSPNRIV